jgi:hypothetical protein
VIDFEVADVTLWVSVDSAKPFPINVYSKGGEWTYSAITEDLSQTERIEVDGFVKQVLGDMSEVWRPNMKRRLLWDTANLRKKKKKK